MHVGWSVGLRAGSFSPYLQVYFGNKTTVVAVTIDSTGSCHATDIGIAYSDDGVIWETLPTTVRQRATSLRHFTLRETSLRHFALRNNVTVNTSRQCVTLAFFVHFTSVL